MGSVEPQRAVVLSELEESKSILCFAPYGIWRVHHQLDALVAAAMRSRDREVTYITCNAFYESCAIFRKTQRCDVCQTVARETLAPFDLPSLTIGRLITLNDIQNADKWVSELADSSLVDATFEDLPIGDWAVSSVMTRFRVSEKAQLNQSQIVPVHRRYLRDTLASYVVIDRVIKQRRVDCLFLFNARFYPYRAAFEAAKRNNARTLVHERGRTDNSFSLYEGENCLGQRTSRRLAADWSGIPLRSSEIQQLQAFFALESRGRGNNWPSYYCSIQDSDVYRALGLPKSARLVAFFSSSGDEVGNSDDYKIVGQQFDLIDRIASHLNEMGVFLIVRHHPHIGGAGENPVETTNFYEAYRRAEHRPSNVRVIMPKDSISSYSLFPYIDGAIAPISTIGLECAAFGVPTLVSSASPYSFDENYTISDIDDAGLRKKLAFLLGVESKATEQHLKHFYRKAYSQLFRSSVTFKLAGIEDFYQASQQPGLTRESVQPGQDSVLDRVCDYLLRGTPVHVRPAIGEFRASSRDEDLYISDQLKTMCDRQSAKAERRANHSGKHVRNVHLSILVDVASVADAFVSENVANAQDIDMFPLGGNEPRQALRTVSARLGAPAKRGRSIFEFDEIRKHAAEALPLMRTEYVLVLAGNLRLHDSSLSAISESVRLASAAELPLVCLSGWVHDASKGRPVRVSLADLDLCGWKDLDAALGHVLGGRELLSFMAVQRDWLYQNLRHNESAFEQAVFTEVRRTGGKCSVKQPLFLLDPTDEVDASGYLHHSEARALSGGNDVEMR